MPVPDFVRTLRERVGHDLLWLSGVTAIVLHQVDGVELLLLGRRADSGEWAAVSGILEPGEQPAVAAAREVFEETRVRVQVQALAAVISGEHPVRYPNGDVSQYLDLTFLCTPDLSADPDPFDSARVGDDESLEVRWFPIDALPAPLATSTQQRLARVRAFRADPAAGTLFVRP
ncbi:hypothetical protein GOHSU_20_00150 [Gordonia hirsuta DSM 44140 = NBRC 16056]|uniref:Nudix hydrolase domain-containing protein n=1 Tax=Gordonia hirsuta DSM 44140 = NBRC 16056 TaxID=1121927 RepID=L7LBT9_9ACTN|nr:NUDIX domain-containing protein [Gordonia hirsuta]GAC57478.1 hypothetical protein GOHSU_20_00150 [Gordonia hirsuta DSM 44140 = NBRC 16056]